MLKKIIVASFFLSAIVAFFIILSDISDGVKRATEAKQPALAEAAKEKRVLQKARILEVSKNLESDPIKIGYALYKRRCLGCHTSAKGQPNRTGPNLWGIVDRVKGKADGFRYSRHLKLYGGIWSVDEINKFIAGPRVMIPETKMTFQGIKNEKERKSIITFLKTLKD